MIVQAVLIAGPTASGKSAAALALAQRIGGALINADSMQVYREVRILTARPDDAVLTSVPHFLFGHVSVHESYSVARYQADAIEALGEARTLHRVPVFVGGTGLYFAALTEGLTKVPAVPQSVRQSIRVRRKELGPEAFFEELAARDPGTVAHLRATDTQRVLRAAEVLEATGRPLSHWQESQGTVPLAGLALARFVLSPLRSELYRRIDARFDEMIEAGALDEAARLGGIDQTLSAAKLLGLRELRAASDGSSSLEAAKAAAKTATRRYAKRQLTWFRHRMADWTWIETKEPGEIVARMLEHF